MFTLKDGPIVVQMNAERQYTPLAPGGRLASTEFCSSKVRGGEAGKRVSDEAGKHSLLPNAQESISSLCRLGTHKVRESTTKSCFAGKWHLRSPQQICVQLKLTA